MTENNITPAEACDLVRMALVTARIRCSQTINTLDSDLPMEQVWSAIHSTLTDLIGEYSEQATESESAN